MALARQLIVTLPGGKKILYPSLRSFCSGFNANHSAVIKAITEQRTYKGLSLRYIGPNEPIGTDTEYYLGTCIGYEVKIAEFTNNDDLIKRIFALVVLNKQKVGPQYRDLLASLQVALNFLNVGEITI